MPSPETLPVNFQVLEEQDSSAVGAAERQASPLWFRSPDDGLGPSRDATEVKMRRTASGRIDSASFELIRESPIICINSLGYHKYCVTIRKSISDIIQSGNSYL